MGYGKGYVNKSKGYGNKGFPGLSFEDLSSPLNRPDASIAMRDLLAAFDIPDNEDTREHLSFLIEALQVYSDREEKYRGGWRDRGWKGNVADILRKTARIRSMFWDGEYNPHEDPDDIVDGINYSVFALRNAHMDNKTGENY